MAPQSSTDEKLAFVMCALKHANSLEVDWKAVAAEQGFTRADNTRIKFSKIVNDWGFKYTGQNQIVPKDGGGDGDGKIGGDEVNAAGEQDDMTTTTTPNSKKRKSPRKKVPLGPSAKKVKTSSAGNDEEVEAGDEKS